MAFYELAVIGYPTDQLIQELEQLILKVQKQFGFDDRELAFHIRPDSFRPSSKSCSAALFVGGEQGASFDIEAILDPKVMPVLPVASTAQLVAVEIPPLLCALIALFIPLYN